MISRRRILASLAAATALATAVLPQAGLAQGKYKSEYKMSLVLGTACRVSKMLRNAGTAAGSAK